MKQWKRSATALGLFIVLALSASAQQVTLNTLLDEMTDLERLAAVPDPAYSTLQASSYDRSTTLPEGNPNWFANVDYGVFIRTEDNGNGPEYVMMDESGPGAVMRIWCANPNGTLRIYLDGSPTPEIEVSMADFLSGNVSGCPIPSAMAYTVSGGYNFYFPMPYSSHCKITTSESDGLGLGIYYLINFRTYEGGTTVESLDVQLPGWFTSTEIDKMNAVAAVLDNPADVYSPSAQVENRQGSLSAKNGEVTLTFAEAMALREMRLTPSSIEEEGLRGIQMEVEFDGELSVQSPLGDFFGSGPGLNPYTSLPMEVQGNGTMISRFPMPFQQRVTLRFSSALGEPGQIDYNLYFEPRSWTAGDYYFHSWWKKDHVVQAGGFRDYNYITLTGEGRYVGNCLNVTHPVKNWWGEGDEKIYLDGEAFPSYFGTGTEDYYGYAFCSWDLFQAPYHNQTRADGPENYGHSSVNRWHLSDDLPFSSSLRLDMEKMQVNMAEKATLYDVVSYWYAPAAASHNLPDQAASEMTLPELYPLYTAFFPSLLFEAESLPASVTSGEAILQWMGIYEANGLLWGGHNQMFWFNAGIGDYVDLTFSVPAGGNYTFTGRFTQAIDYAIVQPYLDGNPLGGTVDLYAPAIQPEMVNWGEHYFSAGNHTLRLEITGKNAAAHPAYVVGLDCLLLEPTTRQHRQLENQVLEGEEMAVVEAPGTVIQQEMTAFENPGNLWSNHGQMHWFHGAPGDSLDLRFFHDTQGRYRIRASFTKASDYGAFQLYVNETPVETVLDLYHPSVIATDLIDLGTWPLSGQHQKLRAKIAGKNGASLNHFFGLDCLTLEPVDETGRTFSAWTVLEGESLTSVTAAQLPQVADMGPYETAGRLWGRHKALAWQPASAGEALEVGLNLSAGSWYVLAAFTESPGSGIFQCALDGETGPTLDLYAAQTQPAEPRALFRLDLEEAGSATLRFTLTGANPAATGDPELGLDALLLQPISATDRIFDSYGEKEILPE